MKKTIIITTGDTDGVGLEVSSKALAKIPKSKLKSHRIILFLHPNSELFWRKFIFKNFKPDIVSNLEQALATDSRFIIVESQDNPAIWVEQSAEAALEDSNNIILVTGPLSKTAIAEAGFKEIGHTEILKKVCGIDSGVYMGFIGKYFGVVLATGHVQLSAVESRLDERTFLGAAEACEVLRRYLPTKQLQKKPCATLGLNPHAGDNGIIGEFEQAKMRSWAQKARLQGPLSADSAFTSKKLPFSVYLACYHDQGLIPFKAIHGQNGVHITLGLPLRRVSVDHGTAKDIFGKKKADPSSMRLALLTAIDMF